MLETASVPEQHVTYQTRAYVRKSGYRQLEQVLYDCCKLYNAALENWRDGHKRAWTCQDAAEHQRGYVFTGAEWQRAETLGEGMLFFRNGDLLPGAKHGTSLYDQIKQFTLIPPG